jgi:formiminoglutamase
MSGFLDIHRGDAPLIVAFPHTGTDLPEDIAERFVSPWLARQDADWWIEQVYAFAQGMGATTVRTRISRSVIDVNRDPSGASLYPGQATTELCPTTTFDGEPLYHGETPNEAEIQRRRTLYFTPYHDALGAEMARLRGLHNKVVLYDAHSIRSVIPRLFDGTLPQFNIGTNGGVTCSPLLASQVAAVCAASGRSHTLDGRFKGGWTTRHYGRPAQGYHAIQMELAMRGYLAEPADVTPESWPPPFDPASAAALLTTLTAILQAALAFART